MEDTVYEANGGGFVGILIWQLDMDFPDSSIERSFPSVLILLKKQQTANRDRRDRISGLCRWSEWI